LLFYPKTSQKTPWKNPEGKDLDSFFRNTPVSTGKHPRNEKINPLPGKG